MSTALILTDIQNDFTQAGEQFINGKKFTYNQGSLGVKDGFSIIPKINEYIALHPGYHVILTIDTHPLHHGSFYTEYPGKKPFDVVSLNGLEQILWPEHCIEGTEGHKVMQGLNLERVEYVIKKGTDKNIDSYSAFYDNGHKKSTGLTEYLRSKGIMNIELVGIAIDYCVKYSALDAIQEGFNVLIHKDMCKGVDEITTQETLIELKKAGVIII